MITLSLCMIVKNEEDVLSRCLTSVSGIFDEIILVDTGSTDHTKEIASAFTDLVYDFAWIDDFSAARNFAFSKASMDYAMWLDADDVLLKKDRTELLSLKSSLSPDVDVVMLPYHTAFDENGNPTFSYYRERIIRLASGLRFAGAVHESIAPSGTVIYGKAAVTHQKLHPSDPDRNLKIFEKQLNEGGLADPREQFYYARELYYHKRYEDAVRWFQVFLNGGRGWVENNIEACRFLAYSLYGLGREDEALESLLNTLKYDCPRAETCCDLGKHFLDRNLYPQAIFWYELALLQKRDDTSGAFVIPDCYDFLPNLQLCVCYDRIGEHQKAASYNEKAGALKPQNPMYLKNRQYFQHIL
ncbi:glycosyltransferase family 2 protein [Anaerolentibacter hominis]|uniref:glycosyltransferase family 2 protein n=1 Tax=Anaerolentibacter hominis TaxID=3079009 RepID=UPI0031B832BD